MAKNGTAIYTRRSGDRFKRWRLRRKPEFHYECRIKDKIQVHTKPRLERVALLRVTAYDGSQYLQLAVGTRDVQIGALHQIRAQREAKRMGKNFDMDRSHYQYVGRLWGVRTQNITSYGVNGSGITGFESLPHAKAELAALEYHYAMHLLRKPR